MAPSRAVGRRSPHRSFGIPGVERLELCHGSDSFDLRLRDRCPTCRHRTVAALFEKGYRQDGAWLVCCRQGQHPSLASGAANRSTSFTKADHNDAIALPDASCTGSSTGSWQSAAPAMIARNRCAAPAIYRVGATVPVV
jgi:hypothetical protein